MRRHWFFDLDGTLFDTQDDIREAWRRTLVAIGRPCDDFDRRYVTGPSLGDMVSILFPEATDKVDLESQVRTHFGGIYDASGFPMTLPYEPAMRWIAELRNAGARLYIATNKRINPTRLILKKFGIADFFDDIYTSDMFLTGAVPAPKDVPTDRSIPKASFLAYALTTRGIAPEDAVMVGDTHIDIDAGRANGMRTVGVKWGYGTEAELALADEIVGSLELSKLEPI